MLIPLLAFAFFALLALLAVWFLCVEAALCRKTVYDDMDADGSYRRVFRIKRLGATGLQGFEVSEGSSKVAEYSEPWTYALSPELSHRFRFRDREYRFRLLQGSSLGFEMQAGEAEPWIFRQAGSFASRKESSVPGGGVRFGESDPWSPDLEIFRGDRMVARLAFAPNIGMYRDRKLGILEEGEDSWRVFLVLVGFFAYPKFGRLG